MIKDAIIKLVDGKSLSREEAAGAMADLMSGEATPAQIGAFLVALRLKGETVEEIAGMAQTMRDKAERVQFAGALADTCGTGGDGLGTFNISTAAAFVAVGAGLRVAKHGNRGMTSRSGSADVLEALGLRIDLGPREVERSLEEAGFAFMFAQRFHPAMKHVGPARREIGVRTVFNILGPLTNPAGAAHQVLGVPNPASAEKMAKALQLLGSRHSLVVSGPEGLDEIGLKGPTIAFEVFPDRVVSLTIRPEELGVEPAGADEMAGGNPAENAAMLRDIYSGARGARRDAVVLNAAAALYAGDRVRSLFEGAELAKETIDSGRAGDALDRAIKVSQSL